MFFPFEVSPWNVSFAESQSTRELNFRLRQLKAFPLSERAVPERVRKVVVVPASQRAAPRFSLLAAALAWQRAGEPFSRLAAEQASRQAAVSQPAWLRALLQAAAPVWKRDLTP